MYKKNVLGSSETTFQGSVSVPIICLDKHA